MEHQHTKKMVLVPSEMVERLRNDTPKVNSDGLDAQMHRILIDKRLNDGDKWKEYQRVLQKFLHVAAHKREPIQLPLVGTDEGNTSSDVTASRQAGALVDELVESFPKTYRQDARNLIKFMLRHGPIIAWNNENSLYVNGERVPDANIIDVLHSIVRVKKVEQLPAGWALVMETLKKLNVPKEYVNNPTALRYLGKEEPDFNPETLFASFTSPKIESSTNGRKRPHAPPSSTPVVSRTRGAAEYKSGDQSPFGAVRKKKGWESFYIKD